MMYNEHQHIYTCSLSHTDIPSRACGVQPTHSVLILQHEPWTFDLYICIETHTPRSKYIHTRAYTENVHARLTKQMHACHVHDTCTHTAYMAHTQMPRTWYTHTRRIHDACAHAAHMTHAHTPRTEYTHTGHALGTFTQTAYMV